MAFQSPSSPLVGLRLKPAGASFFMSIKHDTKCSLCFAIRQMPCIVNVRFGL
jgi:hypothetical protein